MSEKEVKLDRERVDEMLKAQPDLSDQEIANQLKVTRQYVGQRRKALGLPKPSKAKAITPIEPKAVVTEKPKEVKPVTPTPQPITPTTTPPITQPPIEVHPEDFVDLIVDTKDDLITMFGIVNAKDKDGNLLYVTPERLRSNYRQFGALYLQQKGFGTDTSPIKPEWGLAICGLGEAGAILKAIRRKREWERKQKELAKQQSPKEAGKK